MIACIYPDCDVSYDTGDVERDKRQVVDHINSAHADAHAIIACAHDMQHLEDTVLETRNGNTNELVKLPQERLQCLRCGQFELRSREWIEGEQDAQALG